MQSSSEDPNVPTGETNRSEVWAISYSICEPDDPRIRHSVAYRYERIQRNGEELLITMARQKFDPEPLYACCPKCARVYGLYMPLELCSSQASIIDAYVALVRFLEQKEQCPRHLRTKISVRSLLFKESDP
jgi:hypothetical protein